MRGKVRLANDAWEALLSAHAKLMRTFAAQDMWRDTSMREYDVLYTLSKCREPIRQGELTNRVLLSQPALSRMVDRLVARGLIRRHLDPRDGRSVRVSLTEAGRVRQREIGRLHARAVTQAVSANVSADDLRQLEAICLKLAGRSGTLDSTGPATDEKEDKRT